MSIEKRNGSPLIFSAKRDSLRKKNNSENERDSFFSILIADDEEEVHHITKLVLSDYSFEGRSLKFIDAYSAQEAEKILVDNSDIAVILLDVVMETDDAGLNLVEIIRNKLNNQFVRIILRTGQPGYAPEEDVIIKYDINDYKEKADLTSRKLFTAITTALRAYRDIIAIEKSKCGLRSVIDATASLFEPRSLSKLTYGILQQLQILFNINENSSVIYASSFAATHTPRSEYRVVSATGKFAIYVGEKFEEFVDQKIKNRIESLTSDNKFYIDQDCFIGYYETSNSIHNIIYVEGLHEINEYDENLIKLFSNNIAIAFDNLFLNKEILSTQKNIVYILGEVVERRSNETGNHVRRMTEISCVISEALGFDEKDIEMMRLAAPMHDIGKIAIPDYILHKPEKLSVEEMRIMQTHTTEGYNILKSANQDILHTAAIVAYQHHERWDGKGYPNGLAKEEIDYFSRIVALADVVDALGHRRCYKEAWEEERIIDLVKNERGKHFFPDAVDAYLSSLELCQEISENFL